jgi:hypothetical protein
MPRLPSSVFRGVPADAKPESRRAEPIPASARRRKQETLNTQVAQWLLHLARSHGGLRVYAENNVRLVEYFDRVLNTLTEILAFVPKLELEVRQHAMVFAGTTVLQDTQSNARALVRSLWFQGVERLTFLPGLDRAELARFLRALTIESSRNEEEKSALESLAEKRGLEHIRLREDSSGAHTLSGAARRGPAKQPADALAVLSEALIAHDDALVILAQDLGQLSPGPRMERFATASAEEIYAAIRMSIDLSRIESEVAALERENRLEPLVERSTEHLLSALARGREPLESSPLLALLLRLFAALITRRAFAAALAIITSARTISEEAERSTDRKRRNRGEVLLEYLVDEPHLEGLIRTLNEKREIAHQPEFAQLIDAVAPYAADYFLLQLDSFEYPEHRAWICEVLSRSVALDASLLEAAAPRLSKEALSDLLAIGLRQPQAISPVVVVDGLEHEDAGVRAIAVGLLAHFPPGDADQWLSAMMKDSDDLVRSVAVRLYHQRNPSSGERGRAAAIAEDERTVTPADPRAMRKIALDPAKRAMTSDLEEMGTLPSVKAVAVREAGPKTKARSTSRGRSKKPRDATRPRDPTKPRDPPKTSGGRSKRGAG